MLVQVRRERLERYSKLICKNYCLCIPENYFLLVLLLVGTAVGFAFGETFVFLVTLLDLPKVLLRVVVLVLSVGALPSRSLCSVPVSSSSSFVVLLSTAGALLVLLPVLAAAAAAAAAALWRVVRVVREGAGVAACFLTPRLLERLADVCFSLSEVAVSN